MVGVSVLFCECSNYNSPGRQLFHFLSKFSGGGSEENPAVLEMVDRRRYDVLVTELFNAVPLGQKQWLQAASMVHIHTQRKTQSPLSVYDSSLL